MIIKHYHIVCLLAWAFSSSALAEGRFQAPSINAPADAFMASQMTPTSINNSYLKVAVKSKIQRKIDKKLKSGTAAANDVQNNASQQSTLEQAGLLSVDNSVVVLPGALDFSNEVTIVNIHSDSGKSTVGLFE